MIFLGSQTQPKCAYILDTWVSVYQLEYNILLNYDY